MSPTPNVNPTLCAIPCIFWGDCRITVLHNVTYEVISNFNHPWQYFITSCWQEKIGFFGPMDDELIHHPSNICSLIHKKCHPKSYHSDIKYHMTLNNIFSVVDMQHSFKCLLTTMIHSIDGPKYWSLHMIIFWFAWCISSYLHPNSNVFFPELENLLEGIELS